MARVETNVQHRTLNAQRPMEEGDGGIEPQKAEVRTEEELPNELSCASTSCEDRGTGLGSVGRGSVNMERVNDCCTIGYEGQTPLRLCAARRDSWNYRTNSATQMAEVWADRELPNELSRAFTSCKGKRTGAGLCPAVERGSRLLPSMGWRGPNQESGGETAMLMRRRGVFQGKNQDSGVETAMLTRNFWGAGME